MTTRDNLIKPDAVRRLRDKLNLTQEQFAERLGVDRVTVARWEGGKASPHPIFVEKMKSLKVAQ